MKCKNVICGMIVMICCLQLMNCTKNIPPGDYDSAEIGKIKKVVPGTIISMRPVRLHSKNDESLNPKSGTPVETGYTGSIHRSHGYEYVIRLNSGSIISVVQAENIKLKTKQHILVIYGANTRVVPDHGSESY